MADSERETAGNQLRPGPVAGGERPLPGLDDHQGGCGAPGARDQATLRSVGWPSSAHRESRPGTPSASTRPHPVGDFSFRRVPSDAPIEDLEIHQLKYPTFGAERDLNVIFPIERLRELRTRG